MSLRHIALCWVLLPPLLAQELRTTIGRFVDLDGRPVAGAEVTFATSPELVHDAFGPTTILTARTDESGRFRAKLAVGRAHSVWAIGPEEAAGRARSAVIEGVIAGSVLEIHAATRAAETGLIAKQIAELGAGPFSMVVRIDARHARDLVLPIAADGTVELPPLPAGRLHLRILDAGGKLVLHALSHVGGTVFWGEPQHRHFVVRDESGKPLAGARVGLWVPEILGSGEEPFQRQRSRNLRMESAPSDAEGRTDLTVYGHGQVFLAAADGRAQSVTGILNGTWIQDGEMTGAQAAADSFPDPITFTLRPAPALRGRLHRDGDPVAAKGVQLSTEVRIFKDGVSTWFDQESTTRTADDGTFTFASVPAPASGMQLALEPLRPDAPPVLLLPRETVAEQPLDLDLATWPIVTMQLLDATGGPPPAGQLVLLPGHIRLPDPDPVTLPVDRAGRVRAQLEPGTWLLFATDGNGSAARLVTIQPGAATTITLPLTPLARVSGVVLDVDGKPVVGRGFRFNGSQGSRAPAEPGELQQLLRHHAMRLNRGLTGSARTDAAGRFELRFLPVAGVLLIGAPAGMHGVRLELKAAVDLELRERR